AGGAGSPARARGRTRRTSRPAARRPATPRRWSGGCARRSAPPSPTRGPAASEGSAISARGPAVEPLEAGGDGAQEAPRSLLALGGTAPDGGGGGRPAPGAPGAGGGGELLRPTGGPARPPLLHAERAEIGA